MAKSAESPRTTRRRVWRFVIGCLGVVLLVGLWPLKGYRIDEERFVDALRCPNLNASNIQDGDKNGMPVVLATYDLNPTANEAKDFFERQISQDDQRYEFPGFNGNAIALEAADAVDQRVLFVHRNVVCFLWLRKAMVPSNQTADQVIGEVLAAILDGIDREIPGVTSFYNPPVRQWWIDRGEPYAELLESKFEDLFKP